MTDAARGLRLRNGSYRAAVRSAQGEEISEQTASRDLEVLVDAGLLRPVGEKRARFYLGAPPLRDAWDSVRSARSARAHDDPFSPDFQELDPAQAGLF
ncbi:MAG: hypothetical protein ACRDZQ_05010 [Acidimicrobiales bacterium]